MLVSTRFTGREPSKHEIAVDGIVHVFGIVAAVAGVAVLIVMLAVGSGVVELVTASIYGTGLVAMLGVSTAYNLARNSRYRDLLNRIDRSVIFLMIAGTYTPFTILGLSGAWEAVLLALVWTIALLGILVTFLLPRRFAGLSVAAYLMLGWVGVVAWSPFVKALDSTTLALLAVGGVLYSVGTIFLAWRSLPYQHAIWHGFVVAAAAVHYGAVVDLMIVG